MFSLTPMYFDPFFGQIQFAVEQGTSFGARVGQKHADLAILNRASGPSILLFHAC
jgi:hypothetical protein